MMANYSEYYIWVIKHRCRDDDLTFVIPSGGPQTPFIRKLSAPWEESSISSVLLLCPLLAPSPVPCCLALGSPKLLPSLPAVKQLTGSCGGWNWLLLESKSCCGLEKVCVCGERVLITCSKDCLALEQLKSSPEMPINQNGFWNIKLKSSLKTIVVTAAIKNVVPVSVCGGNREI